MPGASWEEIQREANDLVATAAGLGATVRVVGSTGALTGYHWGITRKHAMLGWEAGQVAAAA